MSKLAAQHPNLFRKNGQPSIGLEILFDYYKVSTLEELREKICTDHITIQEVTRFRRVGKEILSILFPFGTTTKEIENNILKYHLMEQRRMIEEARYEIEVKGDTSQLHSILTRKLTEFDVFRGLVAHREAGKETTYSYLPE